MSLTDMIPWRRNAKPVVYSPHRTDKRKLRMRIPSKPGNLPRLTSKVANP